MWLLCCTNTRNEDQKPPVEKVPFTHVGGVPLHVPLGIQVLSWEPIRVKGGWHW